MTEATFHLRKKKESQSPVRNGMNKGIFIPFPPADHEKVGLARRDSLFGSHVSATPYLEQSAVAAKAATADRGCWVRGGAGWCAEMRGGGCGLGDGGSVAGGTAPRSVSTQWFLMLTPQTI